jgi:maleylpyruvate isomerase
MSRHDRTRTLPWLRQGTAFLLATVDRLADPDLTSPSGLPGWTRAHVLGHLARNAEALGRLAAWARNGVPTPMYRDGEQRAAEIEASAALPPTTLRRELVETAAHLDAALAGLDEDAWQAQVRSALGRAIPATEIPWLRVREVWLHAIDLATGADLTALPSGLVDVLLDDVTGTLGGRPGCPPVRLVPVDRGRTWRLGAGDTTIDVTGSAAGLLGWVTGRNPAADPPAVAGAEAVRLPPWL